MESRPIEYFRPTEPFVYVAPSRAGRGRAWRRARRALARRPCGKVGIETAATTTAERQVGRRKRVYELLDVAAMLQSKRAQVAALEAHQESRDIHAAVHRCLVQARNRKPAQPDEIDELEIQCEQLERRLDSSACDLMLRRREAAAAAAMDTRNVSILLGLLEDIAAPGGKRLTAFLSACTVAELRLLHERSATLMQAAQLAMSTRKEERPLTWGDMEARLQQPGQ